jgi:hypothetical protein
MTTPGEKMETPSASFVPIGQTEEGIILRNTATGETKIQPLDFTAQKRRARKQNAPVKERPFYDLSDTQFAEDHFLRSNPGSTPEDYRTILSIEDGVRTGNPDLMMSVGQGADTVENALMSVEGAVPVTAEGDGPKPGTAAVVDNIPKDSDGNFIVSPTQFDQLIKQSLGGLSRARAATKEAAGIDYQEQANELARAQGEAREKYDREMREYEALQERQQLALDKTEQEMRMAEQELKDGTIDPNRAYGGVGGRVAAAFATAIGAFAQGISGGKIPNTALQIINSAIDRDIFAQKEEMRKRKDVLMNKNNIYAQMMKRFGDERMAEQAAINMGYNVAKMKIGELATRHKGAAQQAAAQQLIAQAENKYAEGSARLAQLVAQRETRLGAAAKGNSDAKNLFSLALSEVNHLRKKFKDMGKGEAAWSYLMGMFGPEAQITYSTDDASQYAAARFAVAQFVNKAFSGARGSDRDLAAVMARIPQSFNATINKGKGLKLIADLENSLKRAAGEKGYLEKGDIANYYDQQKGGKDITNKGLVTFQPEINSLLGEGK